MCRLGLAFTFFHMLQAQTGSNHWKTSLQDRPEHSSNSKPNNLQRGGSSDDGCLHLRPPPLHAWHKQTAKAKATNQGQHHRWKTTHSTSFAGAWPRWKKRPTFFFMLQAMTVSSHWKSSLHACHNPTAKATKIASTFVLFVLMLQALTVSNHRKTSPHAWHNPTQQTQQGHRVITSTFVYLLQAQIMSNPCKTKR